LGKLRAEIKNENGLVCHYFCAPHRGAGFRRFGRTLLYS
jgi:hypothetical protein